MSRLKNGLDHIYKPDVNLSGFKNKRGRKNINNLLYTINNNYALYNSSNDLSENIILYRPKPEHPIFKMETIVINREINCLADLIQLIDDYPVIANAVYNINLDKIRKIREPLIELNRMIGIHDLKVNILDQLLFYIQDFHLISGATDKSKSKSGATDKSGSKSKSKSGDKSESKSIDYMHTVLYGSPGTGKTEVAKIIGMIFSQLGILNAGTFKKVVRSDLIAGYLGQTAIKTAKVIKESLGGVLFIDEAYALGNSDNKDSFAKECIDTLCEALSDNKDNLMVIIAGYEDELNRCFFSYNQGLKSRFPWVFKTDKYMAEDLKLIFLKKVCDIGWTFDDPLETVFFETNMAKFPYYGRDMEILLLKAKIAHGRRVFCRPVEEKTRLKTVDLERGFVLFQKYNVMNQEKEKEEKEKEERQSFMMYN